MSQRLTQIFTLVLVFCIPVVLTGIAVRILSTEAFLSWEYNRNGFPPDPYGLPTERRLDFASTDIHYVRAHLPGDALARQAPLYTSREVAHMADVRAVFQAVFRISQFAFILLLVLASVLWSEKERLALGKALRTGGLLTAGLVLGIGLLALFAWQTWFNLFHSLFFESGSWLFYSSDTLIRLFPVQFWFDATLTISVLSLAGGLLMALLGWRCLVRYGEPALPEGI